MKTWISVLIVTCFINANAASYLGPEVGQSAPPLAVAKWLQKPAKAPAGWPVGKVVILEFWATWCGPCVEAIPHLNELAEQFKDKPVQFIAVTDQQAEVVRPFLKKTPIKAWIGLTADELFGEKNPYRVFAIPHTVIIDAHGNIAAIMNPRELTPALIELCLAGKSLSPAVGSGPSEVGKGAAELMSDPDSCPAPGVVPGQSAIGRTPMFQVLIRPHGATKPGTPSGSSAGAQPAGTFSFRYSRSPIALSMPGGQLRDAILSVFDIDRTRLVVGQRLPIERFDFYISLPPTNIFNHGRMLETVFSQAVQATFGFSVKREMREAEVFILRTNATSLEKLARSKNSGRKEINDILGEVTGVNRTLHDLADGLQNAAMKPVLDETGVTNRYTYSVKWDQKRGKPDAGKMTAAVQELGLELVPEKRSLEFVVVRSAAE